MKFIYPLLLLFLIIQSCSNQLSKLIYIDSFAPISSKKLISIRSIVMEDTVYLSPSINHNKVLSEMNNAIYDGIWNTYYWDQLQFIYRDSIVDYKSNGFVFARQNSLLFYELPKSLQTLWFEEE